MLVAGADTYYILRVLLQHQPRKYSRRPADVTNVLCLLATAADDAELWPMRSTSQLASYRRALVIAINAVIVIRRPLLLLLLRVAWLLLASDGRACAPQKLTYGAAACIDPLIYCRCVLCWYSAAANQHRRTPAQYQHRL